MERIVRKLNNKPIFYAPRAAIFISTSSENTHKVKIKIYDDPDKNHTVITILTNHFSADIIKPEFDEMQRWTEQNFKGLTQPIIFDEPGMSVHINNHDPEDWYEFILYPENNEDKIATIKVHNFYITIN